MIPALLVTGRDRPPSVPTSGALGIWYADDAVTTGGNFCIPNEISVNPVQKNLLRGPRRVFNNGDFWNKTGVTVTDSSVVGPDGLTQASHIVGVGNWNLFPSSPAQIGGGPFHVFPAGTYTAGVNVKRGVGVDQQFRIRGAVDVTGTLTATASWQRFSLTFTIAVSGFVGPVLESFDAVTGATLDICNFELFQGAADLGPELLTGQINLGFPINTLIPTVSGQYLDFTGVPDAEGPYGSIQLPLPETLSAFTTSILIDRTSSGSSDFGPLLGKSQTNVDFLLSDAVWRSQDLDSVGLDFGNSGATFCLHTGMGNTLGAGPHVLTYWYDGTHVRIYLDDTIIYFSMIYPGGEKDNSGLSALVNEFLLMLRESSAAPNNGVKFGAMGLWNRALSSAEIYDVVDNWKARFGFTLQQYYFFDDGESISSYSILVPAGTTVYAWPYYVSPALTHKTFGANVAVPAVLVSAKTGDPNPVGGDPGWSLPQATATKYLLLQAIPPLSRRGHGRRWILANLIGTNNTDLFGAMDPGDYGTLIGNILATDYVDPLADAGYEIYTCCLLDKQQLFHSPALQAQEAIYMAALRSVILPGGVAWAHGTGVIDFPTSAGSHFGDATNLSNPYGSVAPLDLVYYTGDNFHLTVFGYQTVGGLVSTRLVAEGV